MSDEFLRFSEAARVYAKYAAVVDKMFEAFQADMSAFVNSLRQRVKSHLKDGTTLQEHGKNDLSWWLEDGESSEEDDVPHVWINTQDPEMVTPGQIVLQICADGVLRPYQQQLAKILTALSLPKNCVKKTASGGWGLMFTITISYLDSNDPVGIVAEPLVAVLTALYEAERMWRSELRKLTNATAKKTM